MTARLPQTVHVHLDVRGLHCPIPVISCKAALQRLHVGEHLKISTNNIEASREILHVLKCSQERFVGWYHDDDGFHFFVQKLNAPRRNGRRRWRLPGLQAFLARWFRQPGRGLRLPLEI